MKIEKVKIGKVKPYNNNPRDISKAAIEKVTLSIKEFGFQQPIVVDKNNIIIAGHTRLEAAKQLKLKEVPVVVAKNLSDNQAKAYRLMDNRSGQESNWDKKLLELELSLLNDENINLDLTGFDEVELNKLIVDEKTGLTEDDAIPEPKEAICKLGDIWQLGKHRLLCGDSTKEEDVNKLMDGAKADMVFTDPPYGINYSGGRTQVVEKKTYGKILNDNLKGLELGNLIANLFSFTKSESDYYICVSPLEQKPFLDVIENNKLKLDAVIVWDKKNAGLGYMRYRRQCEFILYIKGKKFKKGDKSDFDLWQINRDNAQKYVHGTQKPVALSSRAILNSSKKEDFILDIFGGSGSTLIACEKINRNCYMMELDTTYCDIIIERWQNYTGKKAIKIND